MRYRWALDEQATVQTTERLGRAGSKLAVEELLEALADPRFNVRFEAILAIARMPPEARLFAALAEILQGNNPALSVIAAWALGRIGGEQAREPLRQGLDARYRSIRAHSARADAFVLQIVELQSFIIIIFLNVSLQPLASIATTEYVPSPKPVRF